MNCCLCDEKGRVGTPFIDGQSFMVCHEHFRLFVRSESSWGLWAWCKHATSWPRLDGRRVMGKTWLADWFDTMAIGY